MSEELKGLKPKYVDGEPVCSGRKCWAYKVVHSQTGECGIELRYVVEHDVCIASLRQQRDQAIAEREEAILLNKIRDPQFRSIHEQNIMLADQRDKAIAERDKYKMMFEEIEKKLFELSPGDLSYKNNPGACLAYLNKLKRSYIDDLEKYNNSAWR